MGEGISRRGTGYFHSNDMFYEGGWVSAFAGKNGRWDGRPWGMQRVRKRGWVPASARTTGEGRLIFPVFTGAGSAPGKRVLVCGGRATTRVAPTGYGRGDGSPHPRGQRGVGRLFFHVFTGAGSLRENGCGWGWIPAFAGMTKGSAVFWWMTGGSRTAPTEENVVGHEVHPHPNLPPSRGKGFVATERAIFIVMPCFTKGDGFPPSREKREVGGATTRDAPSGYGRGDGFPHSRGQRGEGRLFFPVFTGAGSAREKRMLVCGGWATARVAPTGYGRGDGSPHPRGQRGEGRLFFHVFTGAGSGREERVSGWLGDRGGRSYGVRWAGRVPTGDGRGDGSPHPRGQRGVGRLIFPVFTGAGSAREERRGYGRP